VRVLCERAYRGEGLVAHLFESTSRHRGSWSTRTRNQPTPHQRQNASEDVLAAAQNGDLAELERLFAKDVVSQADGGGFIRPALKLVVGRERVTKYISSLEWGWSGVTVP
jgi:RNA polymerase sigma-70 factor, ECF subfamily